ncbi:hypothetical protein BpHYR1_053279, partial [Brachionus plicatilis]
MRSASRSKVAWSRFEMCDQPVDGRRLERHDYGHQRVERVKFVQTLADFDEVGEHFGTLFDSFADKDLFSGHEQWLEMVEDIKFFSLNEKNKDL